MTKHQPEFLKSASRSWLMPCLLLLNACSLGPDFNKPQEQTPQNWAELPAVQRAAASASAQFSADAVQQAWWRQFNDPLLSALIERALRENLSLRTAAAMLAQSRAQQGIAAADQFPQLNGNAAYTRMQASQKGILNVAKTLSGGGGSAAGTAGTSANGVGAGAIGVPAAGIQPFSLYQYGFDAAWELDLWGRVRREQEAAAAELQATLEQQHAAQLSVVAEVARYYVELRRWQGRRDLARRLCDIAGQQLDLIKLQAKHGIVTSVEVAAAQAALADAQANQPVPEQQIEQTINQLSLLLSERPGALTAELQAGGPLPAMPATVAMGLPSELAQRRPDIRAAEARLHAALADIGMAEADFYPRFTLSGSTGLQALRLRDLSNWSAWQYAIGPSITLPIFQGGRLESTLALRQAQHQQAAIAFRSALLTAWHEIDNSLSAIQQARQRCLALQQAIAADTLARDLDQSRYQQGVSNLLPVLQAKVRLLQVEQQQIDETGAALTQLIALYKALGGGWRLESGEPAVGHSGL